MALSKSAAGAATKAVFLYTSSAGSGGTAYTVPAGKVFKGFLISGGNSSGNFNFTVDGTNVQTKQSSSYGHRNIPVTLPPETVLGNSSTEYFTITGELVDGS
jgi:hypothetical protein